MVFYLHPWEVDPGQPRLAASALSRFRHYRNLNRTESRLRRLLSEVRFGPVREMVADTDRVRPAGGTAARTAASSSPR